MCSRGRAWQWGMHGSGACVAGGVWRGTYMTGGVRGGRGACAVGETGFPLFWTDKIP